MLNAHAQQLYDLLLSPDTHPLQHNAEIIPRVAMIHVANSTKSNLCTLLGMVSVLLITRPRWKLKSCVYPVMETRQWDLPRPSAYQTPSWLGRMYLTSQSINSKPRSPKKKTDYTYPLIPRTHTTNSSQVMCISPVSADMVYYGFENDLDAEIILERLFTLDVDNSPMLSNVQSFLLAYITAQGQNDEKPYVPL